ncbi:hypothetical protein LI154_20525, partial [[Clostridium] scindens]|uniref:hypothetical protein n=1 Tax=Clostridium scindens (strain JCM 10418 / VPI 12708) TaxID=29347 RepID=UPI001D07F7D9
TICSFLSISIIYKMLLYRKLYTGIKRKGGCHPACRQGNGVRKNICTDRKKGGKNCAGFHDSRFKSRRMDGGGRKTARDVCMPFI